MSAQAAGLREGDYIVSVNGRPCRWWKHAEVVAQLTGAGDEGVSLQVVTLLPSTEPPGTVSPGAAGGWSQLPVLALQTPGLPRRCEGLGKRRLALGGPAPGGRGRSDLCRSLHPHITPNTPPPSSPSHSPGWLRMSQARVLTAPPVCPGCRGIAGQPCGDF